MPENGAEKIRLTVLAHLELSFNENREHGVLFTEPCGPVFRHRPPGELASEARFSAPTCPGDDQTGPAAAETSLERLHRRNNLLPVVPSRRPYPPLDTGGDVEFALLHCSHQPLLVCIA